MPTCLESSRKRLVFSVTIKFTEPELRFVIFVKFVLPDLVWRSSPK